MLQALFAGSLLFVASTALGAHVEMSQTDSGLFGQAATLPFKSSEQIDEKGRKIVLVTRELATVDRILTMRCAHKIDNGQPFGKSCSVEIDEEAKAKGGNDVLIGMSGLRRAVIVASPDINALDDAFAFAGLCSSDRIGSLLFETKEVREIEFPDGSTRDVPKVRVLCFGDEDPALSRIEFTIVSDE